MLAPISTATKPEPRKKPAVQPQISNEASSGTADDGPILATRRLAIGYTHTRRDPTVVARNLSLTLRSGELVCLLGPNGAGKSTLMRTLAGLQAPLAGEIFLDGMALSRLQPQQVARRLSVVLTDRVDVGNLSAYGLVALGRHPYTGWSGRLTPQDEEIVRWAIRSVGATDLAPRPVQELSDGERQKVMIARALAQEPLLVLLDEPTAFLDLPRRVEIMGVLRTLARQTGRAILLSTHDLDLALRSADRLWLLSPAGGLQTGAPEDLILNGAFEKAFRSEGVEFDPYSGAFRVNRQTAAVVALSGTGLASFWTSHALEREGFCVDDASHAVDAEVLAHVRIDGETDHLHWRVSSENGEQTCTSLYELIAVLRQRLQSADAGRTA